VTKSTPEYIAVDLDGVFLHEFAAADLAVLAGAIGVRRSLLTHTMTVRAKENGLYDQFRSGELSSDDYWSWFFRSLGVAADARENFLKALCSLRNRDLEVGRLLDRIRARGVRTAIFSNNYSDNIALLERRFELRRRFDALVFSFEVESLKPDPTFFYRAADQLGVMPDRILVVDDSAANIRGAAQAGMEGVLFRGAKDLERKLIHDGLVKASPTRNGS
jgi:putative hydrolase of the HAD superfamily